MLALKKPGLIRTLACIDVTVDLPRCIQLKKHDYIETMVL